jgi:hypothetical protein
MITKFSKPKRATEANFSITIQTSLQNVIIFVGEYREQKKLRL